MKETLRPPTLSESALSDKQREVYDAILSGPRGHVVGPLRVWLQSAEMAERAQALGQFARYDSSLSSKHSELAILVTGRYWSSDFEWNQHAPIALSAGVPASVVDAIGQGKTPVFEDDDLRVIFRFAVELHRDKVVSDAVYADAVDLLGVQGAVDLVAVCGYYTLISMTINAFHVSPGNGPELPKIDTPPHLMFR